VLLFGASARLRRKLARATHRAPNTRSPAAIK
jgi:hypothetical protein